MSDINTVVIGDSAGNKIHKSLYMAGPQTEAIGAAATVATFTITAHALTTHVVLTLPDWTNTVSATISITNSGGAILYTNGTLAQNTTHVMATTTPLIGENTVTITLSGVPGGTGGDTITYLYLTGD